MSKRKKPRTDAFDKEGPSLMEGQSWCERCREVYEGGVCPSCPEPRADTDAECAITQETMDAIQKELEAKGESFIEDTPIVEWTEVAGQEFLRTLRLPPATLAEVAEQQSDIEMITLTEILPVPLTDAEYKEIGKKQAHANQEIAQAENDLKSVKSQYKSRRDSAVARRDEFAAIINSGNQPKPVECQQIKNYRTNEVSLIRCDTGEVVNTRTLTAGERQRGLDLKE